MTDDTGPPAENSPAENSRPKDLVLLQKEGAEPRPEPEHWAQQLVRDFSRGLPYEFPAARVDFPEDHPYCPVCGMPNGLPLSIYVLTSWNNVERHPTLPDVGENIENCERCSFICYWLVHKKGLREACESESGKITVRMRGAQAGIKEIAFALPANTGNDFISLDGTDTVLARDRRGKFGFEFGRQDEEFAMELWSANRVIPVTASPEDRRLTAISAAPFGRKGKFVREVAPRSDDESCFDLARTWLEACRAKHHKLCRQTGTSLPARLLYVDASPTTVLVKEFEPNEPLVDYVTLSYRWGPSPSNASHVLQTTKETLPAHLSTGIEIESLPKTIRDAVDITRRLGISYLWVDRLCIVQDHEEDWVRESSRMCDIYASSTLTISADDAEDDDAGIYGEQRNHHLWRYKRCRNGEEDYGNPLVWTERWPHPTLTEFTQGETTSLMLTVDTSPLTKRAWTLQERLMSTRVLHFTRFEMIWECNSGTQCECARDSGFHSWTLESMEFAHMLDDDKVDSQKWLHRLWYQYVDAYTKRALTNTSDRLPALSGLAKRFQGHLETVTGKKPTFLAGLWREDLATGLTWELGPKAKENGSKTDAYLAPSWSWASRIGSVGYFSVKTAHPRSGRPYPYQGVETTSHIEVLDAGTSLATADPLGRVDDGRIEVSGAAVDFYFDGSQPEHVEIIQRYVEETRCAREFNLMGVTGEEGDYTEYAVYELAGRCFDKEKHTPALEQSKKRTIVVRDGHHRCIAFQPDDVQDVRDHPGEYSSLVGLRVSEQAWGTPFHFDVGPKLKIMYFLFLRPSPRVPGAYERVGLVRTTNTFEKEEYACFEEIWKAAEARKLTLV